jgi:adenosine deaminase
LELCPTSNWLTGAVPSLAAHPLARLHRAGVVTTINTDDPTIMCTNLHQEISRLLEAGDLTLAELEEVLQNGRRVSFLPATEIDRVWVR